MTISRPRHATMMAFASPTLASVAGRHRMSSCATLSRKRCTHLDFFAILILLKSHAYLVTSSTGEFGCLAVTLHGL